jgi:hypothetical protein
MKRSKIFYAREYPLTIFLASFCDEAKMVIEKVH